MSKSKIISFVLALVMVSASVLTLTSCDNGKDPSDTTSNGGENTGKYEGAYYNNADFGMLVSSRIKDGAESSYRFLCHDEEDTDVDIVDKAVLERNRYVEDKLGVNLVFYQNEDGYGTIPSYIREYNKGGIEKYQVIVHELFPLASLSVEGAFLNAKDGKYFDFSQDYWYQNYLSDLAFGTQDAVYLLAGDYFMDVLRTSHALFFNKTMLQTLNVEPTEIYDHVRNGTWTQATFLNYVKLCYEDYDNDGERSEGDKYGFGYASCWGPMIPFVISAGVTFIENEEDGRPVFAMKNEKSQTVLEGLNDIFWSTSSYDFGEANLDNAFLSGKILFSGYQRVCSLEKFRGMTDAYGVVPYPKLNESQKEYITSSHDTTCVGAIPSISTRLDETSAVIEMLSEESGGVMDKYYEDSLKVKFSRDDDSWEMLDYVRNNISNVFPVAYGSYCNSFPLEQCFSKPLQTRSETFASAHDPYVGGAQARLDELWNMFSQTTGK